MALIDHLFEATSPTFRVDDIVDGALLYGFYNTSSLGHVVCRPVLFFEVGTFSLILFFFILVSSQLIR